MSSRLTTHALAGALLARDDAPLRYVEFGRRILMWEDLGRNPIQTTIATVDVLGEEFLPFQCAHCKEQVRATGECGCRS